MPDSDVVEVDDILKTENIKTKTVKKPQQRSQSKDVLSGAVAEISKELRALASEKQRLENELEKAKKKAGNTRELENMLRDKLTKLTALETKLSSDIGNKEHKLTEVREKLSKVRKAREEL